MSVKLRSSYVTPEKQKQAYKVVISFCYRKCIDESGWPVDSEVSDAICLIHQSIMILYGKTSAYAH